MKITPRLIHDPVANLPVLVPRVVIDVPPAKRINRRRPLAMLAVIAVMFIGSVDSWIAAWNYVAGTAPIVAVKRRTVASEG